MREPHDPPLDPPSPPRGRRRGAIAAGAIAVVLAGAAAAVLADRRDRASEPSNAQAAATAELVRTDLVQTVTVDGELGYGAAEPMQSRLAGTVTTVADDGTVVRRGGRLYTVDDRAVVLLYGSMPAYRKLAVGLVGRDVGQLEDNLRALGYTGFTVDREYTTATASAVRRWQDSLGLDETGELELGQVVFLPGAVRTGNASVRPGDLLTPGTPVLSYTGTARIVTIDLEVTDRSLAHRGDSVTITLPDSRAVSGTVTYVGTAAVADEGAASGPGNDQAGSQTPTVPVVCSVADQRVLGDLDSVPVRVSLASQRRDDVLAAPVASLLALREGGYGLRLVVAGVASTIVPVRTGLFAGGLVEVSGPGLDAGTVVETAPS
jgi:peptidoglycan hydrolase-like protein with peptidoglycan-binding domain